MDHESQSRKPKKVKELDVEEADKESKTSTSNKLRKESKTLTSNKPRKESTKTMNTHGL